MGLNGCYRILLSCVLAATAGAQVALAATGSVTNANGVEPETEYPSYEPQTPLDINDALVAAYQSNPTLKAAMAQEPVSRAGIILAKTRINPKLALQGAPAESTYHPVDLTVTVQLGLKRQKRIAAALRQLDSTNATIRTMAWKVRQDTALAFYELAAAERALSVIEDYVAITRKLFSIAGKRKEARDASGLDVLRADAAVSDAQTQLVQAELRRQQAMRQLNIMMNTDPEAPLSIKQPELLSAQLAPPAIPPYKTLLSIAMISRPEYRQVEADQKLQLAKVDLARSARWPDVQLGPGMSTVPQSNSTFLGDHFKFGPFVNVGIVLPINDHQQGPEAIARAQYRQLEFQKEATTTQIKQELNIAYSSALTASKQVQIFVNDLLPKQRHIVEMTEKGYAAGVLDLTTTITAQQTALAARLNFLQALTRFFQARVELERAVGKELQIF